jgi:hypothetical protein
MVEGGGEGAGRGVTSSGPRGGAAGRRNQEVTFNPNRAGGEGTRGLEEEVLGALGPEKATCGRGPPALGIVKDHPPLPARPRGGKELQGRFFFFPFSRIQLPFRFGEGSLLVGRFWMKRISNSATLFKNIPRLLF